MNKSETLKQFAEFTASAVCGGRWLFVFAGLLCFFFLSGAGGLLQTATDRSENRICAAEYPDSPEEALRSNPLPPLQQVVRSLRSQRLLAPFKLLPFTLPVPAFLLILPLFVSVAVLAGARWNRQCGLRTSILVRAGPLCFEKICTFFQNSKQNTRKYYYERVSEKEFGIRHLLRFLRTSGYHRFFCLQNDFLRTAY